MLELQTVPSPFSRSGRSTPPPDARVRRFLIESERRVILHCRKLLDDPNLPAEERRRLMPLVSEAEAWLRSLAA